VALGSAGSVPAKLIRCTEGHFRMG